MGMFDTIKCLYPLPDGFDAEGLEWQTKDLECELDEYTITADGRLVHDEWKYESVPDNERPYPEATEGLKSVMGSIRRVVTKPNVEVPYHGDIVFYGSNVCASGHGMCVTDDDQPPQWREYSARFTNGRLQEITLVSHQTGADFHGKHVTSEAFWSQPAATQPEGL